MLFPSMEVLQAFGANEELTEIRREAGAVIESGVMTQYQRIILLIIQMLLLNINLLISTDRGS